MNNTSDPYNERVYFENEEAAELYAYEQLRDDCENLNDEDVSEDDL